jgi:hypothetical protein
LEKKTMNANLMTCNAKAQGTRFLQRLVGNAMLVLVAVGLLGGWQYARAEAAPLNSLQEISYAGLPGNQVQIIFKLSQPVSSPARRVSPLICPRQKANWRRVRSPSALGPPRA